MVADPDELHDLGADESYAEIIEMMYQRLGQWARRMSQRTTRSDADLAEMRGKSIRRGIVLGLYDGTEVSEELTIKMRGRPAEDYTRTPKRKKAQ